MAALFISYRREDSAGHAGRLCDRLTGRLGEDRVFMDVEDMKPGQNFLRAIDDTLAGCACVIAIIGPRWLEMLTQRAQGRDDFVRHELSAAFARDIMVIPVLVAGARMPDANQLPPELAQLSRHHAIEVRDNQFDQDVARLIEFLSSQRALADGSRIRSALGHPKAWWLVGSIILVAVSTVAFLFYRSNPPAAESLPVAERAATAERPATAESSPATGVSPSTPDAPSTEPPAPVPVPDIDGEWVAEMQSPGRPAYRIRLTLSRIGDAVTGTVRYPTGEGSIQEGRITGRTLTFFTSHVPQFEDTPAIIRWVAEMAPDRLRVAASSDSDSTPGVATRVTSP
jgi:hypothetical protein